MFLFIPSQLLRQNGARYVTGQLEIIAKTNNLVCIIWRFLQRSDLLNIETKLSSPLIGKFSLFRGFTKRFYLPQMKTIGRAKKYYFLYLKLKDECRWINKVFLFHIG